MRWIVSVAAVVAGLAVAFLYLHSISVLSSVTAVVSTVAPRQDAPATSFAAATPGDDRQQAGNSGPANQVAQARTGSPTSTETESGKKQLMEALDAARAELANSGATAFEIQQFEAQVKAAMEAIEAHPSEIDQRAGAVATERDDGTTRHRRKRR